MTKKEACFAGLLIPTSCNDLSPDTHLVTFLSCVDPESRNSSQWPTPEDFFASSVACTISFVSIPCLPFTPSLPSFSNILFISLISCLLVPHH